jgi:hypothetical protein
VTSKATVSFSRTTLFKEKPKERLVLLVPALCQFQYAFRQTELFVLQIVKMRVVLRFSLKALKGASFIRFYA